MKRSKNDHIEKYFLTKYEEMGIKPTSIKELRARLKKKTDPST